MGPRYGFPMSPKILRLAALLALSPVAAFAQTEPPPPPEVPAPEEPPSASPNLEPVIPPAAPPAAEPSPPPPVLMPPSAPSPAPTAANEPLAGWSEGTAFIRSADNSFILFPSGRLHIDGYLFRHPTNSKLPTNSFLLRRARLELFGWIGDWF